MRSGNFGRAREFLQAALEHNPGHIGILIRLAAVEARLGRPEEATSLLEQARRADPDALQPRILLAEQHLRNRVPAKALALTEQALATASGNPRLLAVVGRARLAAGRAADAADAFRSLVEAVPNSAQAHMLLAVAYRVLNDAERYEQTLRKALEIDPEHLQAKIALAEALGRRGDLDAAAKLVDELKQAAPENPAILDLDGVLAMRQNRPADAVVAFRKAWEQRATSDLARKLAAAQQRAGDPDGSLETLEGWLKQSPNDVAVRMALANQYANLNQWSVAKTHYIEVIEAAPENTAARNNLAWVLLQMGDANAALPHAERILTDAGDDPRVLDTVGLVHLELGNTERAVGLLRDAAERGPTNSEIRFHLAKALARLGNDDEAREILRQVLSSPGDFSGREDAKSLLERLGN